MADSNGSGLEPPSSLFLSTATLPAHNRLPVWREVFGRTMVRLDIEPVKGTVFHAEGELCALPGAAFASVTVSPVRVSRTRQLIADDVADMVFLITADAPLRIAQHGREQTLDTGDAIFLRGGECSVIQSPDKARFINISVPIGDLTPMLTKGHDLSMIVISRQSEVLRLLLGYVGLLQTRETPLTGELGQIAAGHVRELLAAMIRSGPDCESPARERGGVRVARLRAIKDDIGRYVCEPALSIDMIAMRHGISPRYIRKLFQEDRTTFSDFIVSLRLERSRHLLLSPAHATCTIASIAHASGFNDLSYFNRTFRRRYGITPSDLRSGVPARRAFGT